MSQFTIRVYFILFNEQGNRVLVSDECIAGRFYTKFPGGGLEWGEGPVDCARREALEELGQEVEVIGHFYTTDFFVRSWFHESTQVISIYYRARLKESQQFITTERSFGYQGEGQGREGFRWVAPNDLDERQLSFPIDRKVGELIRAEY